VHDGVAISFLVAGGVVAVVIALLLRTRLPAVVVALTLLACGVALAVGGLLLLDDVSPTEWVVTVAAMAFLAPAHVRVVLGPFGPKAGASPTVQEFGEGKPRPTGRESGEGKPRPTGRESGEGKPRPTAT
jgi:hypothetical protein